MELPNLKVVSWNVSCGIFQTKSPNDPITGCQYIVDTLLRLQADIVGLQEVLLPGTNSISFPDIISGQANYPYYKAMALSPSHLIEGQALALAIFSKYPITDTKFVVLPNPNISIDGPTGAEWKTHDKGFLICKILLGNQSIFCICGHLPPFDSFKRHPSEAAFKPMWEKIEQTLRDCQSLPLIAFVDFNTNFVQDHLPIFRNTSIFRLLISQPTRTDGRLHDQIFCSDDFLNETMNVTASNFDHHICDGILTLKSLEQPMPISPQKGLQILHLSDLHFGPGTKEDVDWKTFIALADREKRKDRLLQFLHNLPVIPAYVIVSGDLTIAGREEGFKDFISLVDELIADGHLPEANRILIVPGNHDVMRRFNENYASVEQRWKFFREYISKRFASPWFPDQDPSQQQLLKEIQLRLDAKHERFGGPSQEIDGRFGRTTRASLPFLIDLKERLLIYAFNSASVSGTTISLSAEIEAAAKRLRRDPGTHKDDIEIVLAALERELSIDPARIDPREFNLFNDTINVFKDKIVDFDSFLKIAVLHHHVDPVIPEEVTKFENLINAGRFKFELSEAGFQLVLHGHKHWPNVHIDVAADNETRKLIVSGGTIGGDTGPGTNPGFYWLEVPQDKTAIHIDFVSVSSVGNPRISIANALKHHQSFQLTKGLFNTPDPLPTRISLNPIFLETQHSLFNLVRVRPEGLVGWSHLLDEDRISTVGSAYALSILKLINSANNKTENLVPAAIDTLLKAKNPDGGWSASSQSTRSRPEPTAFVLSSLSKWLSYREISDSVEVLESMIDEQDKGLWENTYCLSTVARILSEIKPSSAKLALCSAAIRKGAHLTSDGRISHWGSNLSEKPNKTRQMAGSVLHTAHAMIALQRLSEVSEMKIGMSAIELSAPHHWILRELPWRDTTDDINRIRERHKYDSLVVKHFTLPWVLVALLRTGLASDNPTIRAGIIDLLDSNNEGLWDWGEVRRPVWATYDALLALTEYSLRYVAT